MVLEANVIVFTKDYWHTYFRDVFFFFGFPTYHTLLSGAMHYKCRQIKISWIDGAIPSKLVME